jgi:ABC-2 type transport system ATP-binding protein
MTATLPTVATTDPPTGTAASHRARDGSRAAGDDAVVVDGLTKRFGARTAVDHVSFSVPAGTVAGLIGPNGAGKTTIMAMLLGLVQPTSGTATVFGSAIDQRAGYLHRVGALIEGPAFHPAVSGVANLRSLAVLAGLPPTGLDAHLAELIDTVGLTGRGDDRYGTYSLGMKQRLGIAAALLGNPELVILDEPTNGLDPMGMQDIRNLIKRISGHGRTVIVSSHLLSELEQVCDWLIVLDRGGVVHLGPPESLGGSADTLVLRLDEPDRLDDLAAIAGSTNLPVRVDRARVEVTLALECDIDAGRLAGEINRRAHVAGIVLTELHHDRADLEARYLNLVNFDDSLKGSL